MVPFLRAPLLKSNSRKKGTLIIKELLRNQGSATPVVLRLRSVPGPT